VIAALYPETLHLVAAPSAKIETVSDLRGKRVALGVKDSADFVRARAVLAAYGLSERRVNPVYERPERAATMLEQGKLDAFFVSGGAPMPLVTALTGAHKAVLVPLTGKGRDRLLKNAPGLEADVIPAGLYPGMAAVPAVRGQVLWMVRDTAQPDLVYALTRALFDPGNRPLLDQVGRDGRAIRLDRAQGALPAPLHDGAARFYREAGKLPSSAQAEQR
jgi:TRAP transporter TAXI family solute receptor